MNRRAYVRTPMFAVVLLSLAAPARAGSVESIADFGANPSGIGMYLYTPANVKTNPAVLVNVHACHGKGTDVCGPSGAFAQQADKYGFLVVCPSAVSSDGCWDVHSTSVLTHEGGGDALGIVSMVQWVIDHKNGDPDRVYVAGHSSGGMMTNVMLGSYPDIFKAGAAYAGVPFGCYAQGPVDSLGWNSDCAQGKVSLSGQAWGDLVRGAYPSFSGARPRLQIWHGTNDDVVFFQNFKEELKQWTDVFGLSATPTTTENNALQSTWIRTRYADKSGVVQLEAIEETGQPHNLVVDAAAAVHFFGLDATSGAGGADASVDARVGAGAGGRSASSAGGPGAGGNSGGTGGTTTGRGGAGAAGAGASAAGRRISDAGADGGGPGSGGNRQAGGGASAEAGGRADAIGRGGAANKGGTSSSSGGAVNKGEASSSGGAVNRGGASSSGGAANRGGASSSGAPGGAGGASQAALSDVDAEPNGASGCAVGRNRGPQGAIWLAWLAALAGRGMLRVRRARPSPQTRLADRQ